MRAEPSPGIPISITVEPRPALSPAGVPLAMIWPWSTTASVVGEPVGLLQVLGGEQDGRAVGHEVLDHGPQLVAAPGVEAGGRLVEEQDRRAVHQRGGEVEAPPHPTGVRLDGPVGGVDEVEALEELAGPLPDERLRQVGELADQAEVLAPGQVLVDGGVLARPGRSSSRTASGVGDDVVAEEPGPRRHRGAGSW